MIIDCHSHHISAPYNTNYLVWVKRMGRADYGPPYLWNNPIFEDVKKRLEVMEQYGIDYSVITYSANTVQIIDSAAEEGMTKAEAVSDLNRRTWEMVRENRKKIGATAWIDLRLGDSALEEMDRTSDWALGYSVLTGYVTGGQFKMLDAAEFAPFWRRAAELGKPVFIHFSSLYSIGDRENAMPGYMNESMLHAGMGQLVENTLCLSRLVMSGVFDRHPSLKVVMGQLGGLYPFMLERFSMLYAMHLNGAAAKGLSVTDVNDAAHFMRNYKNYTDNVYVDTHSMSECAVRCAAEIIGEDKILFGSDLPITPASWGIERQINGLQCSRMKDETKRRIFAENAAGLLGLEEIF